MIRRSLRGAVALGALTALILVSAGCSSTQRDAATITYEDDDGNSHTVHVRRDKFEDQVAALQQDENVLAALSQQAAVEEFPEGQADPQLTATWLNLIIQATVIEIEFESLGLELSDEQLDAAEQSVSGQFGDAPAAFHDLYVKATAQVNAVFEAHAGGDEESEPPTEEEIRAFWEENTDAITACPSNKELSHILVADEAAAADLQAQLAAGADFGELADANSTDPQALAGGSIGCLDTQPYGEEFGAAAAAAPLGEVTGPITSDAGTHLVLVNEWAPTFEKFHDQIAQYLQQQADQAAQQESQQRGSDALNARTEALDVRVDPRFGTWGFDEAAQAFQVTAPVPPEVRSQRETRLVPSGEDPGQIPIPELEQ